MSGNSTGTKMKQFLSDTYSYLQLSEDKQNFICQIKKQTMKKYVVRVLVLYLESFVIQQIDNLIDNDFQSRNIAENYDKVIITNATENFSAWNGRVVKIH